MTNMDGVVSEAIANIDVEKLGLSNKSVNCLKQNNIMVLGDMLELNREKVSRFYSAGVKTVNEIMDYLEGKKYMEIKLEEIMKSTVLHYVVENTVNNEVKTVYFLINNELVEDPDIAMAGFSSNLADLFINSNITKCNQLVNMQFSAFIRLRSMGTKKIESVLEFLREITFPLYADESMNTSLRERLTENEVIKMIGDTPVTYFEIKGRVESVLSDDLALDQILEKLKKNKVIEETQRGYVRYLPWAVDCFSMLKNKEPQVISHRMQGMTLDQTGKVLDLTRERVRQIEEKALKKMPKVRESRFAYWYNNYEMKQNDFTYVFDISDVSTIAELNSVEPKVKAGNYSFLISPTYNVDGMTETLKSFKMVVKITDKKPTITYTLKGVVNNLAVLDNATLAALLNNCRNTSQMIRVLSRYSLVVAPKLTNFPSGSAVRNISFNGDDDSELLFETIDLYEGMEDSDASVPKAPITFIARDPFEVLDAGSIYTLYGKTTVLIGDASGDNRPVYNETEADAHAIRFKIVQSNPKVTITKETNKQVLFMNAPSQKRYIEFVVPDGYKMTGAEGASDLNKDKIPDVRIKSETVIDESSGESKILYYGYINQNPNFFFAKGKKSITVPVTVYLSGQDGKSKGIQVNVGFVLSE